MVCRSLNVISSAMNVNAASGKSDKPTDSATIFTDSGVTEPVNADSFFLFSLIAQVCTLHSTTDPPHSTEMQET